MTFKRKDEVVDNEEALIHGGGPKIGRIHFAIESYKRSKRTKDWSEMYEAIDDLFLEVEAYLSELERRDIMPSVEKLNAYIGVIRRGGQEAKFYGEARLLLVKMWRVLRRLELDMAGKTKQSYLTGAM